MSFRGNEKKLSVSIDVELVPENKEDVEKIRDIKTNPAEFNQKLGKSLSQLV
jgi:hypothetical protein